VGLKDWPHNLRAWLVNGMMVWQENVIRIASVPSNTYQDQSYHNYIWYATSCLCYSPMGVNQDTQSLIQSLMELTQIIKLAHNLNLNWLLFHSLCMSWQCNNPSFCYILLLQSAFWYIKLVSLTLAKVLQIVTQVTLYKLEWFSKHDSKYQQSHPCNDQTPPHTRERAPHLHL
jgi:hypothetical protein